MELPPPAWGTEEFGRDASGSRGRMLLDPKGELCWPPTTSLLTVGLPMIFRAFWVLFYSSWGNFGAIGPLLKFLYVFINLNTKASLSGGGRGEKRTFSPGICACISEDHVTTSSLLVTESYLIARAFKEKKKKTNLPIIKKKIENYLGDE